jgi:hypothetical protein
MPSYRHRTSRSLFAAAVVVALAGTACDRLKGNQSGGSASSTAGAVETAPAVLPAIAQPEVPFAGTFTKYAVSTFKGGKRVVSTNSAGQATITIAQGKAIWAQTYTSGGQVAHVTQTYAFTKDDVREVPGGFDVTLVWKSMDSDTKKYSPDKNSPKLQARKQGAGWQIGLLTTDNNGVSGGVEFK